MILKVRVNNTRVDEDDIIVIAEILKELDHSLLDVNQELKITLDAEIIDIQYEEMKKKR